MTIWNKKQIKEDVITHDIINNKHEHYLVIPQLLTPAIYGTISSASSPNLIAFNTAATAGSRAGYALYNNGLALDWQAMKSFKIEMLLSAANNTYSYVGLGDSIPTAAVPPAEPAQGIWLQHKRDTTPAPLELVIKLNPINITQTIVNNYVDDYVKLVINKESSNVKVTVTTRDTPLFIYDFVNNLPTSFYAFAVVVTQDAVSKYIDASQCEIVIETEL
ncbi:MAG: hypothetical protein QXW26_04710 [Candidatus Nitrosocaldus sp.]